MSHRMMIALVASFVMMITASCMPVRPEAETDIVCFSEFMTQGPRPIFDDEIRWIDFIRPGKIVVTKDGYPSDGEKRRRSWHVSVREDDVEGVDLTYASEFCIYRADDPGYHDGFHPIEYVLVK